MQQTITKHASIESPSNVLLKTVTERMHVDAA